MERIELMEKGKELTPYAFTEWGNPEKSGMVHTHTMTFDAYEMLLPRKNFYAALLREAGVTYSLPHPLTGFLTCLLSHSLTHLLTSSPIYSLSHLLAC